MSLRVLIAGGGLGGLTLAHGLRNAGLQPLVFERGPATLDLDSSYRIHIDANGSRALHACLPADVWQTFERRSAAPPRGVGFATEQLQELAVIHEPDPIQEPVAHAHPISRAGLRQLLLSGLEDVIAFDSRVVGYEHQPDGQVLVRLADGKTACGDVLVGADGSASAVRKQLLPHAQVVDTGVAGIAGKVHLTDEVREQLPRRLVADMTMVLPVHGMAMFLAPFQRRADISQSPDALDLPEHVFWVLIGRADAFTSVLKSRHQSADTLRDCALGYVQNWHPLLRFLVTQADSTSLTAVPLYTSRPVGPWPAGRVTLLGDAIHTMTPLQGLGGNTALVDAAWLARALADAAMRHHDPVVGIAAYEARMREYGFGAMKQSLRVSNAVASTNVVGRLAFRGVLHLSSRMSVLKNLLFRRPSVAMP